jgi:hypothetical protein
MWKSGDEVRGGFQLLAFPGGRAWCLETATTSRLREERAEALRYFSSSSALITDPIGFPLVVHEGHAELAV